MDITITCACGFKVTRSEGSAGATFTCACGRELKMPPLDVFRRISGTPEDPERAIRGGIDVDSLFPDRTCCGCDIETEGCRYVIIECEPGFATGGFDWLSFLATVGLSVLLMPIGIGFWILFRWRPYIVESRGKGYRVPLLVCADCQKRLTRNVTTLEFLRRVPLYARLLEKYPEARVRVE